MSRPALTAKELKSRILCDLEALAAMTRFSFETSWPDERAAERYAKRTREAAEPLNSINREVHRLAEPFLRSHDNARQAQAKMRKARP